MLSNELPATKPEPASTAPLVPAVLAAPLAPATVVAPPTATAPSPLAAKKPKPKPEEHEHKDSVREALETVVFVVFLVLLLMSFVAQAFVIPTGSMATTLLGVHRECTCDKCGYEFQVNDRDDEMGGRPVGELEGVCPICNFPQRIQPNGLSGGDKVLVNKAQYDLFKPKRLEVIVFKFPGERREDGSWIGSEGGPQKDYQAHNFIKRLYGLPGERLAIGAGDVYLSEGDEPRPDQLSIIRKPPKLMLEMRRIVHDNDYHPKDLGAAFRRWGDEGPAGGWQASADGKTFSVYAGDEHRYLHYRHRLPRGRRDSGDRATPVHPQLITDNLDYNADEQHLHWVDDLMLDFEIEIEKAAGELTLELLAGIDTHLAVINLETGECTLKAYRYGRELRELGIDEPIAKTRLNRTGKHRVRFANFDDRLTLWVDGNLAFGDGREIESQTWAEKGPRLSDLRPVGIGIRNASVKVRGLQVWRDIYYTRQSADVSGVPSPADTLSVPPDEEQKLINDQLNKVAGLKPRLTAAEQRRLAAQRVTPQGFDARPKWPTGYYEHRPEFYPQKKDWHPENRFGPDEYFALGDNSTRSKDSRSWGLISERLLLGRAVSVYWPLDRFGLIR